MVFGFYFFILTWLVWCKLGRQCANQKIHFWEGFSFGRKVQTWYHEPHPPLWVIVYWVFILKYFWNILNKKIWRSLKFSLHYYVMVYIKNLLNICDCKKNSSPFTSLFIALKHWLQCFQMFLGIFHSSDWFQTYRLYIPIHWQ
jgi:hypothetical protein